MTTIVQYVPKWLRARLQKPAPKKPTIVNKKKRQLLPTLPNQTRSGIFSQHDSPAGYRVRLTQALSAAQSAGNTLVLGMPGGFVPLKNGRSGLAPEAPADQPKVNQKRAGGNHPSVDVCIPFEQHRQRSAKPLRRVQLPYGTPLVRATKAR
jgi:hypothetical protein